jgi:hypothetical protein
VSESMCLQLALSCSGSSTRNVTHVDQQISWLQVAVPDVCRVDVL